MCVRDFSKITQYIYNVLLTSSEFMQHDDEKTMMKMMYRGISISRYFKTHYSSVSGHDTAPLPDCDTGGLAVYTCVV